MISPMTKNRRMFPSSNFLLRMVTVRMTGHKQVVSVKVDPEVLDPEDPEILEDLMVAAFNEATQKVDETLQGKMGSMAANMPNIF